MTSIRPAEPTTQAISILTGCPKGVSAAPRLMLYSAPHKRSTGPKREAARFRAKNAILRPERRRRLFNQPSAAWRTPGAAMANRKAPATVKRSPPRPATLARPSVPFALAAASPAVLTGGPPAVIGTRPEPARWLRSNSRTTGIAKPATHSTAAAASKSAQRRDNTLARSRRRQRTPIQTRPSRAPAAARITHAGMIQGSKPTLALGRLELPLSDGYNHP